MFNKAAHKYIFAVALLLLLLPMAAQNAQNRSSNLQIIEGKRYYIHKIEKSQSLYAISKLYSVSLEELYSANPELKTGARAGQEIKVPYNALNNIPGPAISSQTVPAIDTNRYITHRIIKGETLYSIIKKFNSSEKQLTAYNPTLAQGLKEGQVIIVGEKTSSKKKSPQIKEQKEARPAILVKEIKPNTPIIDSSIFKPVSKPRKTSYNVALILPFRLDATINQDLNELVKSKASFPMVPALAIDFYLGFKRAMDSLVAKDFEINLEVYDIDDKDSTKIIELAASQRFKELDFIFGPLYASGFKTIARKAKELHIPTVSPIAQQNKILFNNIYISKTNPSQFTLLENLVDYCVDSLKNANTNIILMTLSEKDKKEMQFVNAFKKRYNERAKPLIKKDSLIVAKGLAGFKANLHSGGRNVVVSLSNNQVLVTDFVTQLSLQADKKDIVLCSWESLSSMDNIDQEYLNQLHYTFPHQFNLTNTQAYRPIIDYYKMQQESMPGDYFYVGFDIAWYYLMNLKEKGPEFVHTLNTLPLETNYMNFKFSRPDATTGFDNGGVYIFRYNNYQLQKTGWK